MIDESHGIHLSSERLQAFLDGELPERDAADVRHHVHACAICRAELDAWRLVFKELTTLPHLEPSPGLAQAVMSSRARKVSMAARIRVRAASLVRAAGRAGDHLGPDQLQDFLDSSLPGLDMHQARDHLGACAQCRGSVEQWLTVVRQLEALPSLAPSEGFAERVMARIEVRDRTTALAASPATRLRLRLGALWPTTRRAWAAAVGMVLLPTAAAGLGTYFLVSHPLLTPGYLASFLWWEGTAFLADAARGLFDLVAESALVFRLYSAFGTATSSPLLVAALFAAFSMATLAAVLVLYRTVFWQASAERRGYAHASS